jgi:hypothetical protein
MDGFEPEISEIEQKLVNRLTEYSRVKWYQQVEFPTPFATFFLDVGCLVKPGRAIGIECDGQDFHRDQVREFCRDALILGTGRLAHIYHIEAWSVERRYIDWLFILSRLEPDIFTSASLEAIDGLAKANDFHRGTSIQGRYTGFMYRRTHEMQTIKDFIQFARAHCGTVSFSKLVELAKEGGSWLKPESGECKPVAATSN